MGRRKGPSGGIRSFIALPLPRRQRAMLAALADRLDLADPVPEENHHITLAFLGDVPPPMLAEVDLALSSILFPPFEVEIRGIDMFGSIESPRSLHAKVAPIPPLLHLQRKVVRAVEMVGLQLQHRRFVPHVTLARFGRNPPPHDLVARIAHEGDFALPPFTVRSFVLYRSELTRHGPFYEPLARYPEEAEIDI